MRCGYKVEPTGIRLLKTCSPEMKSLFRFFVQKPATLLLVDGFGALLTGLTLLFVAFYAPSWFGLPEEALVRLGSCAICIAACSVSFGTVLRAQWQRWLSKVWIVNLLYVLVVAALLIGRRGELTTLGLAYFVAEAGIILLLVAMEIKVWQATRRPRF